MDGVELIKPTMPLHASGAPPWSLETWERARACSEGIQSSPGKTPLVLFELPHHLQLSTAVLL